MHEISVVEVHEVLNRKKRDLTNPRHPRNRWRRQMQQTANDNDRRGRPSKRILVEKGNHSFSRNIFDMFNDPKWGEQWYLRGQQPGKKLSMRVMEAWDAGYTGRGVTVTILDDGIEYNHPVRVSHTKSYKTFFTTVTTRILLQVQKF